MATIFQYDKLGAGTFVAFLIAITISLLHIEGGLGASAGHNNVTHNVTLQNTSHTTTKVQTVPTTLQHIRLHLSVHWRIINDGLVLTWNYNTTRLHHIRYYICIQEVQRMNNDGGLGDMSSSKGVMIGIARQHFIYIKNGSTNVRNIKGLKPRSFYKIKVIAISKMIDTVVSRTVHVNTYHLEFVKVYNLTATNITNTSASFEWHYRADIVSKNMFFKLNCSGLLRYKQHNQMAEERIPFVHKSRLSLKGIDEHLTSKLVPNALYTCHMLTVTDSSRSLPYSEIQFLTSPGKPPTPGRPEVIIDQGQESSVNHFVVKVHESSNKFGPLSHYIVYAVPVKRPHGSPLSAPFTPTIPYSQLLTKSITAHLASSVSSRLPFIVDKYHHDSLPDKIYFNNTFKDGAFKPDTHYAFVVVAFSRHMGNNSCLHSMSLPSDPPVYIDKDYNDVWIKRKKSRIHHLAKAALYTVMIVVSILMTLTLIIVLLNCLHKKRDGINLKLLSNFVRNKEETGGSSDEENLLYIKKSPSKRKQQSLRRTKSNSGLHNQFAGSDDQIMSKNELHTTRVDKLKQLDNTERDDQEVRLDLFSISTPPDSPCTRQQRPTSPLTTSHRSIHVPTSHSSDTQGGVNYVTSPVAAHVNYNEDILAGSFTLPRSRPYVSPDSMLKSQYYYKVHTPGTPMPKMPDPEPPKMRRYSASPFPNREKKSITSTRSEKMAVQVFGKIEDKFVDDLIIQDINTT